MRSMNPFVQVGDMVHFFRDPADLKQPLPAIVTRINGVTGETLDLNVIQKDATIMFPQSGVRHATDPRTLNPEVRILGCWDHTPRTQALLLLLQQQEAIEMSVATIGK